jgi:hypothetical protein
MYVYGLAICTFERYAAHAIRAYKYRVTTDRFKKNPDQAFEE